MKVFPRRTVEISSAEVKEIWKCFRHKEGPAYAQVRKFEKNFSDYIGVKHAIAVPSARLGFSALLDAFGFMPQDEIILSSYNYHVIPALIKNKGFTPVFVDIENDSWNIDSALIERAITKKTRAVIATHLFGRPCELASLLDICRKHGLVLIEDAAHACGAVYRGRRIGSFGDVSYFSFGTGKSLVTLGGGMLVTDSASTADKISCVLRSNYSFAGGMNLKDLAKNIGETILTRKIPFQVLVYPLLYSLNVLGSDAIDRLIEDKYCLEDGKVAATARNFSDFQAALGLAQLGRLDGLNKKRAFLSKELTYLLKDIEQIQVASVLSEEYGFDASLYFCIAAENAEKLRRHLLFRGVDTKRGTMRACSSLSFFNSSNSCPRAEKISNRIIELPCYPRLEVEDICYLAGCIRKFYNFQK